MNDTYERELAFAKSLARDAKLIAGKYYKTDLKFETKDDTSPVTVADKQINELVIKKVQEQFPDHGVLGEEESWENSRERLWVCDPIDGTISFSIGVPTFMFSIALVVDGEPVFALTSDLDNGETFWATKDRGAYLDDKPIKVSNRPLDKAWVAFPTNLKWLYEGQAVYKKVAEQSYQTDIVHGGVFKGMLVARGLVDAVIYLNPIHPWDMAAVKLIVDEACGKVTSIDGEEQRYDNELTGGLVISNSVIHGQLLKTIKETMRN